MRKWIGWIFCLLLLASALRVVSLCCDAPKANASEAPTVVTIEDVDGPAQQVVETIQEPPPVVEQAGPTLDERVGDLESAVLKLADNDVQTLSLVNEAHSQSIGLFRELKDGMQRLRAIDDAIVQKVKELQDRLAPKAVPPEAAGPPKPQLAAEPEKPPTQSVPGPVQSPVSEPAPQFRIVMDTADWCAACADWKQVEMPLCIRDGIPVETVDHTNDQFIDGSLPRFAIHYGHLFVRQSGYLTQQRLRDIKRSLLDKWAADHRK